MRPDADKSVDPASKSAPSTADEKKNAVTNQSESDDKTAALENLPDEEKHILKAQLDSPSVTVTYFSLYRYADAWDYLVLLVSALCAIAGGAALPLFMIFFGELANTFQGVFVNTISYDEFTDELVKYVLYVVYLGIGLFVTDYVSTVGFIYTGERATRKIRERYLEAILRQNIAYFDKIGAGEVTTRITSDTNLIQDGISHKVGLTLTAVSTFVSAFIIAYIRHWKLALICSSTILALVFIMGGSSSFIVKYTQQNLQSAAEGGSVAEEVFSSIRTATAFGSQQRLADQYEKHLKMAEKSGIRMQIIMALMMAGMFSVMYLNYGLGFWMGSRFLVDGSMDIGQVLTILMAILIGSFTLGYATTHAQAFTGAVAAGAKIFATIDRLSPLDPMQADGETLDHVEGTIELRNVKHIYPSRPEIAVMDDVSLLIPAGKTTALVGPSGSGKSTIVGLVERFYSPVRGEILLDGRDIRSLNLRWLRQQISIVSQEPVLFATTIFENIRYGLIGTPLEHETGEKLRQRIEEAAKIANAHDFITSLPDGYNTHVGERGFLLSGGQKQRIAIARAVASDPKILLLDEATSALDTKSEGVVQAALDKAAEGRTTIVIAHRLSTIKNAHNIVVLVGGKIVEQGTHGELIEREGTYAKLVEAQKLNEERDAQAANVASEDDTVDDDSDLQKKISRTVTGKSLEDRKDLGDLEKDAGILERQSTRKSLSSVVLSRDKTEKAEVPYSLWTLFKFVASFNRPEVFYMIIGLVFSVLAGGGQPTQAVFFAKAITALSLPPSMFDELRSEANFWSLMFLMLGIVSFFLFAIQGISFAFCSEKLIRRARNTAFRTMLRQDIVFFDKEENSTGSLTAFLSTETKHLSSISGATLGTILMQISTMVAALVVALAIGWKLALVCISVLPVMLGCGFYRIYAITEFESRAKKAYENSASYACEATSAIRTVASLTREGDILESYREQLREQARRRLISVSWTSLLFAASQALSFFCMALGFWYGGTLLGKGEYTIFQFFVCFSEVMFGSQTAGTVFSFAPDMGKAKNAAAEIKKLLDRKPEIDSSSDEGEKIGQVEGTIEFRDVHFRYPTRPEQPVLRGLSLTVKPGQYVALVGPSGCGKSTTIALLERFYDPLSGAVYVDGKDISALNVTSYRNHLALVSQEPTLYQGTIRENILLGSNEKDIPEEAIINACKNANIYDFILSLPDGLDTVVGSKGVMLSGGQKQRVAIARALLRDPKILLLDEATSALDSESEKVVQEALDNAAQGRTTIAVAHRLSTIQNADVIYVFDQGRIVESGTHAELLRKKGRYYEMVNLQSLSRDN